MTRKIRNSRFYCKDDLTNWFYSTPVEWLFPESVTRLGYSDFAGIELINVDFSYADLSNVKNLDKATVKNVCGNSKTKWPNGISFPNCAEP